MAKRPTQDSPIINEKAEGATEPRETQEPTSPVRTTTLPAVDSSRESDAPAAETGVTSIVSAKAEGSDNDDVQDASRSTAESETSPAAQPAAKGRMSQIPCVLIIEDTAELAEFIQATLQRMNIQAVYETHGGKGLVKFDELRPDLVFLDISLPDMTGWEFLEGVKQREKDTGRMPRVIVITAYGDPANRLIGKFQGVSDYLIKPFTADEVERSVLEVLGGPTQ